MDVDLAAYAEAARQVNARLHREPDPRQQLARVRGLEVVEVGAGAVQVAVDGVAGAVYEPLPVAGRGNHAARRVVEIGASHGSSPAGRRAPALGETGHRGVARV